METLIKLIFAVNGYVFGGYVRDMVDGSTPKDIDCFVPQGYIMGLWRMIMGHFPNGFTVVKMKQYDIDYYGTADFVRMLIHHHSTIQLDITSDPLFAPDFDVNMLKLTQHGISLLSDCPDNCLNLSLGGVLGNIRDRKAYALQGCSDARRKKMISKGWEII